MPGLKPVGSEKAIIYRILDSVVAVLLMSVICTRYNLYMFLKTYGSLMIKIFLA
jgi:hypothetical protein